MTVVVFTDPTAYQVAVGMLIYFGLSILSTGLLRRRA